MIIIFWYSGLRMKLQDIQIKPEYSAISMNEYNYTYPSDIDPLHIGGGFQFQPSTIAKLFAFYQRNSRIIQLIATLVACLAPYLIYYSQYELCTFGSESECTKKFLLPKLPKVLLNYAIAGFIVDLTIFLILKRVLNRIGVLIHLAFLIQIFVLSGHKMTEKDFQILFQLAFACFIIIFAIITATIYGSYCLYRRSKSRFLGLVVLALFLIWLFFQRVVFQSCNSWSQGLGLLTIKDNQTCNFRKPEYCWYDVFEGFQDLSRLTKDCSQQKNKYSQSAYLKKMENYIQIPSGTKYLELPRTEYFSEDEKFKYGEQYQRSFLTKIKPLKNLSELSQHAEAYYDLEKEEFVLQVKRNEALVTERKQVFEALQKMRRRPKNVITIWVDAVSRPRFHKKLTKTLQKFEEAKSKYTIFEAMKYIAIGIHTFPISLGYEYGISQFNPNEKMYKKLNYLNVVQDWYNDRAISLSQEFQQAGYIVGKARGQCNSQITVVSDVERPLLHPTQADHDMIAPICDLNAQDPEEPYSLWFGPYSVFRRCLSQRDQQEYIFEYGWKFLETYSNEPKYLELYFLEGHEGTGEVVNYLDDPMAEFFERLLEREYLKDSIVMLLSDHGLHMQGLFYIMGFDIVQQEIAVPGLFIIMDPSLLEEKDKNQLLENQQNVVTVLDIHYLMEYFINGDLHKEEMIRKNSLFSEELSKRNSGGCKDIPKPQNQYCPCT